MQLLRHGHEITPLYSHHSNFLYNKQYKEKKNWIYMSIKTSTKDLGSPRVAH